MQFKSRLWWYKFYFKSAENLLEFQQTNSPENLKENSPEIPYRYRKIAKKISLSYDLFYSITLFTQSQNMSNFIRI